MISDAVSMLLPLTHLKTETVEVVRITDPLRHLTSEDVAGDVVAVRGSDHARQVLSLIADLPGGEPQRCFMPGWGIRAHGSAGQLFQMAFCFRCNKARLFAPDLPAHQRSQTFDGQSPVALELLRQFQAGVSN